jgi:hypothetical protein
MIERFGKDRYLKESGAEMVNQDTCGTLWRKGIPGDEPLVMVEVINSTAEEDGSFKITFLPVPPAMSTACEAVAWTFGMTTEEYAPVLES